MMTFEPERAYKRWALGIVTVFVTIVVWAFVCLSSGPDRVLGWGGKGRFFDLRGSIAAGEVARAGGDAYAINPLDPSGRPHLYSSWWLGIGKLGVTQRDLDGLGAALIGAVLLVALASWWPATWGEAALALVTLISPAWLLAIYRGNNDLVIFVLLAAAIRGFQRATERSRIAAAAGVGALAVLKYFPGVALVAVLGARTRREVVLCLAAFTALVAIGYPSLLPAFAVIGKYAPQTGGLHSFGATILIDTLSLYFPAAVGWLIGAAAAALGYALIRGAGEAITPEAEQRELAVVISGAVVLGCFAIGASFTYKFVFLWWVLPWLIRDARAALGRRATALLLLLLISFWADGVVAMVVNGLAPAWSAATRLRVLPFLHGAVIATQLGYWIALGALLRLTLDWSRRQIRRLASGA